MKNVKKGFTVAELLIVVAIIGILVAVSIPILSSQLEKSKEATDLANMRNAKAAAIAEWMVDFNPYSSTDYSRNYDAASGVMMTAQPMGYGKSKKDSTVFASKLNAHGIPNDGYPKFINVTINSEGEATITWTVSNFAEYLTAVNPLKGKTLMEQKNIDNNVRVAADQATLRAIGEDILSKGWTVQELKDNLSILANGNTVRIADYYVDKTGSYEENQSYSLDRFRLNSKANLLSVLDEIGFDGGVRTNGSGNETLFSKTLFYSDELATNKFIDSKTGNYYSIDATKRSIILENVQPDADGKVKSFTIYSKAMDEEANMSASEKAKFRIYLTR